MAIRFRNITISKSVIKNSLLIASVMLVLYIASIIFSINILKYYLNENLDARIRHEIEHIASSVKYENNSFAIIRASEFDETDLTEVTDDSFLLQIYSNEGALFLQSKNLSAFGNVEKIFPYFNEIYHFENAQSHDKTLRVGYEKLLDEHGEQAGYIQLATFKTAFNELIEQILFINLFTFPLVVVFILFISLLISGKTFAPINKIISLAQNISASNLNARLSFAADPEDELGKLKNTLNDLFERLEIQIRQITEFSDNASHQLMTPLTAINTEIEYLLKGNHDTDEYRESLKVLKEQTERMIQIIRTMLLIAKNSELCTEQKTIFNFSKLATQLIENSYKNQKIELNIDEEIYLRGSADHFLPALQNLIDNAIKYSGNDRVTVSAHKNDNIVSISIQDFGIGIDDNEKEKIFERFYRSDKAERLGIKGYGLGLNLVKAVVTTMNGTIQVRSNSPKGTVFTLTFPGVTIS